MRISAFSALASLLTAIVAGISVEEGDSDIVVYAEDDSTFTVTIGSSDGSITSILYGGTEYQNSDNPTALASGLGSATVSYTTTGNLPKK
jgi:rhamnogalacturonan endolyase